MFITYLRRELGNRKKYTVIIAAGMALAIALVIIVNGISAGVKNAQETALQSVYGVGTDITISKTAAAGSGGQKFDFPSSGSTSGASGSTSGSSTSGTSTDSGSSSTALSQDKLTTAMGSATYSASALKKVTAVTGVSSATATLSLQDSSFSGKVGAAPSGTTGSSTTGTGTGSSTSGSSGTSSSTGGSSSFSVDSFTVTGISTGTTTTGPMTATKLTSGRYLKASDDGKDVVVVDKTYATTESLKTGSTLTIGGTKFTVVGIVSSTSSDSATASDTYIPLDTAQKLSSLTGKISDIYVSADSSSDVASIKTSLEKVLPSATVSTEADLASSVSGSLATVSNLLSNLGTWLSALVLGAALVIAVLFTISGVSRRTREFGTLKAIGWSNGRIVRQVTGESLVQGLIGGITGAVVGIAAIVVVNVIAPTLSSSAAASSGAGTGPGAGGPGAQTVQATTEIALQIPITASIIVLAVGLAMVGGLMAGAAGGWRASKLRPAAALRSVA